MCGLLDRLQPALLVPQRQTAKVEHGEVWMRLVHALDRHADLDVAVGDHTSHIYGLGGHDEAYPTAGDPDEAWRPRPSRSSTNYCGGVTGSSDPGSVVGLTVPGSSTSSMTPGVARSSSPLSASYRSRDACMLTSSSVEVDYGCESPTAR